MKNLPSGSPALKGADGEHPDLEEQKLPSKGEVSPSSTVYERCTALGNLMISKTFANYRHDVSKDCDSQSGTNPSYMGSPNMTKAQITAFSQIPAQLNVQGSSILG